MSLDFFICFYYYYYYYLAALPWAALFTSGTAIRCYCSPHHRSPPSSAAQNRRCQPRGNWFPWLTALAAPWPWQQRCGNSSARSWKYVDLNQCISSSAAHGSAAKYRNSYFDKRPAVSPTIGLHLATQTQNLRCQPRGNWSSWLAALASPRQQRCGNSSARSWKYVHLNQCISSNAAKNRSWERSINDVILTRYCSGDQIEKNERNGGCSTYGAEGRCIQGFVGETWGKETTWKTQT